MDTFFSCLTLFSGFFSQSRPFSKDFFLTLRNTRLHSQLHIYVRDGGLSILCHSCAFACQQKVLKTFPGPGYLRSEDEIVWLWHLFVNLYIWLTSSSCYGSILLTFVLIKRDGGLSTLRHSCEFACQQDRVLKTFSFLEDIRKKIWKKTLAAIPMLLFCF